MVLIDMEMPKRCKDCWFMDREEDWCSARRGKHLRGKHLDPYYIYGIKDKPKWCPLKPFTPPEPQITTNIYDQEEIHHNCTVQILRNSFTGEVSVGWWENEDDDSGN